VLLRLGVYFARMIHPRFGMVNGDLSRLSEIESEFRKTHV